MDCIVDPFVRSIAITNAIDSFNSMNLNRQPSPGLYLGQWLIGILVSTTGGFALNAMKGIYTIKNNHLILGVSCVLYILFDSQIYWHVFRLDIGHEINDYKICIAAFNVSFFAMRRIVDDNGEDITKYLERKEELLECKEVEENELIEKLNVNGIETTVQSLSKGDTSDIKARVVEEITKRSSKRLSKLA